MKQYLTAIVTAIIILAFVYYGTFIQTKSKTKRHDYITNTNGTH